MSDPISKIMIIDDSDDIRDLLESLLTLEGYAVSTFSNGNEALNSIMAGNWPRMILLDWRMPILSGKEFLEKYSQIPEKKSTVPVYIFTAEEDSRIADNLGQTGMLKKPVNVTELLSLCSRIFATAN